MLYVINEAIRTYKDSSAWKDVQNRAMTSDFSWKNQARKYEEMYGL
jgi:glycogen synthase